LFSPLTDPAVQISRSGFFRRVVVAFRTRIGMKMG